MSSWSWSIGETQCVACYNVDYLLEREIFVLFNLFKMLQHIVYSSGSSFKTWADEGQRQVQLHVCVLYICINKTHQSLAVGGGGRKFEWVNIKNSMWKTTQHTLTDHRKIARSSHFRVRCLTARCILIIAELLGLLMKLSPKIATQSG